MLKPFFFSFFFLSFFDTNYFVHIYSSSVEMSLHTKFQFPRLPGRRTTSLRLNSIGGGGRGAGVRFPHFSLSHISSSWVEIGLHTEFELPRLPGSRFCGKVVGGKVTSIFWFIFLLIWLK